MFNYQWVGFLIVFTVSFMLVTTIGVSLVPAALRKLLIIGFLLRAAGSLLRYFVLVKVYGGIGDAMGYYNSGVRCAQYLYRLDFSFLQIVPVRGGDWWGTQAVTILSGVVVAIIGPSMPGEFLLFSMVSLVGLVLICKTFHANYPQVDPGLYGRWVFLWPSLWFWPSAVGKDALMILALGLLLWGFCSRAGKIRWVSLSMAFVMAVIIRPHVAAIMAASVGAAHWFSTEKRWDAKHILQGLLVVLLSLVVLRESMQNLGLEDTDLNGVEGYVAAKSGDTKTGGSSDQSTGDAPSGGLSSLPRALVSGLFRPFPWEAKSFTSGMAFVEASFFWFIVFKRRKRIYATLKSCMRSRLLLLSLPYIFMYSVMLGLIFNLGILTRQRTDILPLFFLWVEALPVEKSVRNAMPAYARKVGVRYFAVRRRVPLGRRT